jgi:hypothetical protein
LIAEAASRFEDGRVGRQRQRLALGLPEQVIIGFDVMAFICKDLAGKGRLCPII